MAPSSGQEGWFFAQIILLWIAEAVGDAPSSVTTQIGDPAGSHITHGAAEVSKLGLHPVKLPARSKQAVV